MMIIDPVTLGDVACTRASVKYVYDRTGTLVQVPANTLAVTYDPSDLTKAPYALVEGAATNLIPRSEDTIAYTSSGGGAVTAATSISGFSNSIQFSGDGVTKWAYRTFATVVGTQYTFSIFVQMDDGGAPVVATNNGAGAPGDFMLVMQADAWTRPSTVTSYGNGIYRVSCTFTATTAGINYGIAKYSTLSTRGVRATGYQLEVGAAATSYIPTPGDAQVTRAADVIASGAGLVYSNVPITETAYSGTATYALNAIVYDPATYLMYQSIIATNTGKALTDTTSWVPTNTSVNRRQMFDQYNNTQTSNAEEIIVVLSPQAIAQGVYIGNADASDVRISCYDPTEGLVYQETQNLLISDSGSSFYSWCFKRIRKKSYAVSVQLPPYRSGLVTIALKKPGGTPKCGMCVLGLLVDIGLAQYGLSREIKDYSTVNFNFDGTSNVVKRNFAKIMDVDVIIDNDMIDGVIESLEGYRQKPVAWIGTAAYGSACLYGTYTSFKNVIQYPTQSAMSLQIQGTV
jgi:hypothetical protein